MTHVKTQSFTRTAILAGVALPALCAPAWGQVLEEVVVTATKRAENIQDVPISISAFSGSFLEDSGITDLQELGAYAPNLNLSKSSQVANQRIAIRGVGSVGNNAIEPSVAVFIDGVYYPRPSSIVGKLQDIAAVEVLRGPQGTLFGRNASMGALNIRTKKPDHEFSAEVWGGAGSFDYYGGGATINNSLSDTVAGRVSLQYSDRNGFGDSSFDGADIGQWEDAGLRGALLIDFTDRLTATVRADWKRVENNGTVIEVLPESVLPSYLTTIAFALDPNQADGQPGPVPDVSDAFDYDVHQKHDDSAEDEQWGGSLELEWTQDNYTVKSITAYRDWQNDTFEDAIRLPADILQRVTAYEAETISQEFQYLSEFDGPLQYVAGLYLYHEEYVIDQDFNFGADFCTPALFNLVLAQTGNPAIAALAAGQCSLGPQQSAVDSEFEHEADSYAVFAQATYDLSDTLTGTVGLRYTDDEKDGSFSNVNRNAIAGPSSPTNPFGLGLRADESADLDFADSQLTWMANLRYTPTADLMLFGTVSTGYKAGGFNSEGGPIALGDERTFDSEEVVNVELGVKSTLAERVMLNATLFRTEIDQFQDRLFDGLGFKVVNAGELRQQGIEVDVKSQVTAKLFAAAGVSYLDSEFLDYDNGTNLPGFDQSQPQDLAGARNNFSPNWQASLTVEWRDTLTDALEWYVRGEYQFVDEQNPTAQTDNNPATVQPSYELFNARFGLGSTAETWDLTVFGRNLADEGYCQTAFYQPLAENLGLVDSSTGNAMTRCVVGEPRSYGIEYRHRI